jgi:hypothetical protein
LLLFHDRPRQEDGNDTLAMIMPRFMILSFESWKLLA